MSKPELFFRSKQWDAMLRAVLERLRQAAGEVLVVAPAPDMPDPVTLIQTMMLECVGALDQLHAALKHDRTLLADLTS